MLVPALSAFAVPLPATAEGPFDPHIDSRPGCHGCFTETGCIFHAFFCSGLVMIIDWAHVSLMAY